MGIVDDHVNRTIRGCVDVADTSDSFEKDFFYFVDADYPDQTILSDRIDVDEPSGGWGLNLDSVTSPGDTDQVIEHFSQVTLFMRQQQEQTTEEEKPFLWTVRGPYHGYNMHFFDTVERK